MQKKTLFQKTRSFLSMFLPGTLIEWLVIISIIGMLLSIFWPRDRPRAAERRIQCAKNMQKILEAIQHYESEHGPMPAVVEDAEGRPLYSWRVLLLPYLDRKSQSVYKKLRLDEPWDSEYHRSIKSPEIYRCPGTLWDAFSASYLLIEDRKPNADGSPYPILVETQAEVFWMQPKDINMDEFQKGPLQTSSNDPTVLFGSYHAVIAHAGFSDRRVEGIENKPLIKEEPSDSENVEIP